MNRILSADWVLPIEGPPIEAGAVVIEDGRIAAVGTHSELMQLPEYAHVLSVQEEPVA